MKKSKLLSKKGKSYSIQISAPSRELLPSAYLFAFHKSGSTLMNDMITRYCSRIDQPVFSLFDSAFSQGVDTLDIDADAAICFSKRGYVYTGFRHFPEFDLNLEDSTIILLTRDPRDMLVSSYYSMRWSHVIPRGLHRMEKARAESTMLDIDQFVLKRKNLYSGLLRRYREALEGLEMTVYRYEDVVYRKEAWLTDMVEKIGLKILPKAISEVAKESDVFPSREDATRHIRQVHPGNYKEKLSDRTVMELNEHLLDFLKYFNYEI